MAIRRSILSGLFVILLFGIAGCGGKQEAGALTSSQEAAGSFSQALQQESEGSSEAKITGLTVEYRRNPLGLDEETPVFSWKMESEKRGQAQTAYRLCVADSAENMGSGNFIWDSGKVESDLSVAIPYEGPALQPSTRYHWNVAVWDNEGKTAFSGEDAWFETGLMGTGWNGAEWIGVTAEDKFPVQPVEQSEYTYTIEYDFQGEQTSHAGIVFGADSDRYGEYFVWSVGVEGENLCLKMCRMDDFHTQESETCSLEDYFSPQDYLEKQIHMRIEVNGKQTVTWLDGVQVADFELPLEKAVGRIGLYNARTEAMSYMDNLLVTDGAGNELYREDFERPENTVFSPEYLDVSDGRACIRAGITLVPGEDGAAPLLRKSFEVKPETVKSARLYASALGIYQLTVNGERITENFFDPGQMVYEQELSYCTYDVTPYLREGENSIMACLGHGWYDRAVGTMDNWKFWGTGEPAFLAQLMIEYADGTREIIVSDGSWEATLDGPVRRDDMYQGEVYDAARENGEWNWFPVSVGCIDEKFRDVPFRAYTRERVDNVLELQPVAVTNPKPGTYVYDFGQEFTGVCRIRVKGAEGDCITIRHSEALNTENLVNSDDIPGTIWTRNLLTARNTDYYYLKGDEEESYAPSMVGRAFRYVQISGLDEDTQLLGAEGLVLMSDLEETGSFESSDIWLNRLWHNVFWSQRSNFLDIPTDCPQRDERFGWSGDIGAFSSTAVYNMQARSFLSDYLRWLRLQQKKDGSVADMAPHTDGQDFGNNGWGDALVVITWELYQQYADRTVIEENFDAMCAWVDYLVQTSENGKRAREKSYGDHLQYHTTPQNLTDTAQSAYSALLLSKMAAILDRTEETEKYRLVYEMFRKGWQETWLEENGMLSAGTQTSYALGLRYQLYPEELKEAGEKNLLGCVQWFQYHPSCGYVGMPHLLPALSEAGYSQAAYQLLLQKSAPSWNYWTIMGATTTAESWTGYVDQGEGRYSLHGSLNHYASGSIGEWFYSGILGIQSAEDAPGFKKILLAPQVTDLVQYAGGGYTSVYGRIESRWENTEEGYLYQVTIPANTTAELILPPVPGAAEAMVGAADAGSGAGENMAQQLSAEKILEGGIPAAEAEGVTVKGSTAAGACLELTSGTYEFRVLR